MAALRRSLYSSHYFLQHEEELTPAKTVLLHRNGDRFFAARKLVVNRRCMPTFEHFLAEVTTRVPLDMGAVRRIYTPCEGHRVRALDQLRQGQRLVAAGRECFKKIDYFNITPNKCQKKMEEVILPVVHSRIVVSSKWASYERDSCTINVFTNGDMLIPPLRMLISKHTLKNWDRVLAAISEKVHPYCGFVQRLYRLDGHCVGPEDIENNQYYVAAGKEKFKCLPYYQWVPKIIQVDLPRATTHSIVSLRSGSVRGGKHGSQLMQQRRGIYYPTPPETHWDRRRNEQVDTIIMHSKAGERPDTYSKQINEDAHFIPKKEKADFHAISTKTKELKHSADLSTIIPKPERGVFRAYNSREEMHGAAEVKDDKQMKIELPIDQVPAEVIHEEEIPVNSLKVTRRTSHYEEEKDPAEGLKKLNYYNEQLAADKVQSIVIREEKQPVRFTDGYLATPTYDHLRDTDKKKSHSKEYKEQYIEVDNKSKVDAHEADEKTDKVRSEVIQQKEPYRFSDGILATPTYFDRRDTDKDFSHSKDYKEQYIKVDNKSEDEDHQADEKTEKIQYGVTLEEKIPVRFSEETSGTPTYDERRDTAKAVTHWRQDKSQYLKENNKSENKDEAGVKTDTTKPELLMDKPVQTIIKSQKVKSDVTAEKTVPGHYIEETRGTPTYDERRDTDKAFSHWKDYKDQFFKEKDLGKTQKATSANKSLNVNSDISEKRVPGHYIEDTRGTPTYDERRDTDKAFSHWKDYEDQFLKEKDSGKKLKATFPSKSLKVHSDAISEKTVPDHYIEETRGTPTYNERRDTDKAFSHWKDYEDQFLKEKDIGTKQKVTSVKKSLKVNSDVISEKTVPSHNIEVTRDTPTYDERRDTDKAFSHWKDNEDQYVEEKDLGKKHATSVNKNLKVRSDVSPEETIPEHLIEGNRGTPAYDARRDTDKAFSHWKDYKEQYISEHKPENEHPADKKTVRARTKRSLGKPTPFQDMRKKLKVTSPNKNVKVQSDVIHEEGTPEYLIEGTRGTPAYDEKRDTNKAFSHWNDYKEQYISEHHKFENEDLAEETAGKAKTERSLAKPNQFTELRKKLKVTAPTKSGQVQSDAIREETIPEHLLEETRGTPAYDERRDTDTAFSHWKDYKEQYIGEQHKLENEEQADVKTGKAKTERSLAKPNQFTELRKKLKVIAPTKSGKGGGTGK